MPEKSFETFNVTTDDGLTLHGRDYGRQDHTQLPVICLAGLTRNSRDFHQLGTLLSARSRRVITLDYRGRGLSMRDPNPANYNIVREAQDVLLAMNTLGIEKTAFVGTSRGGLILHMLAAMAPERLAALVFNDIGPVIEADGLRKIRDYLSVKPALSSLADAAEHLERIHGKEFTVFSKADWRDMADAVYREIDGTVIADCDPAIAAALNAVDFTKPLPDLWPQFELLKAVPLLVIRGENSGLLSSATVAEMMRRHPNAQSLVASGQGHAPILHMPDIFKPVSHFLTR